MGQYGAPCGANRARLSYQMSAPTSSILTMIHSSAERAQAEHSAVCVEWLAHPDPILSREEVRDMCMSALTSALAREAGIREGS
jgi:hypothetical protein